MESVSSSSQGISFPGIISSLFGGSQSSQSAPPSAPEIRDQQQSPSVETAKNDSVASSADEALLPAAPAPVPFVEFSATERKKILMEHPLDQVKLEKKLATNDVRSSYEV